MTARRWTRWLLPSVVLLVGGLPVSAAAAPPARSFTVTFHASQSGEAIAEIRTHGNHVTSDDELRQLSGLTVGAPFGDSTIEEVTRRLRATGRFDDVTVLKRFASIADASRIVVVIIVNEGPVRIVLPDVPGGAARVVSRRGFRNLMWLPILTGEDGYGFTYGAQLAYVGLAGERSRLSFPLTWGGLKQAGIAFDRSFAQGPFTRVEVGAAVQRQRNPAFDLDDDRMRTWARAERAAGPVRLGGEVGWQQVSFDGRDQGLRHVSFDATVDTRLNPVLPRDAIYASWSVERLGLDDRETITRTRLDARGYLGIAGQSVIALRVQRDGANAPLPRYLRPLLGGWSNLRGFEAGTWTGDTVVAGALEWVLPLGSPLQIARLGISLFVDTGAAFESGQRVFDQRFEEGVGGSVWLAAAAFRMNLAVARGLGQSTRVNFGGGITF